MIYFTNQIKFLLFVILFLGTAAEIFAGEGDLDPTFGNGGIVITDNGSSSESITSLAVQPDGKIIAAGSSFQQTVIVRYNPDGSIDSTFGASGKVIIPSVFPTEVALQPDGKIVLTGTSGEQPNGDFYVARLNSDGSFDITFNGTGAVILDLRGTDDNASSAKILPNGKIVIGGNSARPESSSQRDYAIVRLNPDGSLDPTFDGDGKVFHTILARIVDLEIQPDGKILAAGRAVIEDPPGSEPNQSFVTIRTNPDGSLDTTFDGDGMVFIRVVLNNPFGGTFFNEPESLALQPDGKIIVAGRAGTCCAPVPTSQGALVRYNADGSLDSSFGTGGKAQILFQPTALVTAFDVAIQDDNKIVFVGSFGNIKYHHLSVARLSPNGVLDTTFHGDGWNVIEHPLNIFSRAFAVAIQPDGKILAGGNIHSDFLLTRFNAAGHEKVADFDGDGRTDLSVFRSGTWFINPSGANNPNSFYTMELGLPTDKLVPADYDGDGRTDIAIWRENVSGDQAYFYILQSATNSLLTYQFGNTGDDPRVVGDWDGDGKADLAVYRKGASAGQQSFYYYIPSSAPINYAVIRWGTAGDEVVRGDFDGDGRMDAAVFRPSDGIWYILQSSNNQARFEYWGLATDKRISGDFDGDGKTDLTVYRDGVWYVLQSSDNQARYEYWGLSSDQVVAGDYDGDGRTDFAVWRAGVYYILQNSNSQAVYRQFGVSDDIPVASAFIQ